MIKKLSTVLFLLLIGVFASTEYAPRAYASVIGESGNPPPVQRYSGFSPISGVVGVARYITHTIFANDTSLSHQIVLKNNNTGLPIDCQTTTKTLVSMGVLGQATTTVTEALSGSACNLNGTFDVSATISDGASNVQTSGATDSITIWSLSDTGSESAVALEELDRTRFVLISSPEDEEVVGSTTPVTFSAYVYVNPDDLGSDNLTSGWYVELFVRKDTDDQLAVANRGVTQKTIRIYYDFVSTYNEVSTTTIDFDIASSTAPRVGRYTVTWKLHRPSFFASISSFFGLDSYFDSGVLATETSHFVVDELTPYDTYVQQFTDAVSDSFASTTLATLTERLNTCNPLGPFSMMDCLAGLFTLDPMSTQTLTDQFKEMIAVRAPVGYVTRVVSILSGETATSSLPVISFDFPASSPLAGETLSFNFNTILSESREISSTTLVLESDPQKNIWDIIMPVIDTILYLLLLMMIIKDVTGVHRHTQK